MLFELVPGGFSYLILLEKSEFKLEKKCWDLETIRKKFPTESDPTSSKTSESSATVVSLGSSTETLEVVAVYSGGIERSVALVGVISVDFRVELENQSASDASHDEGISLRLLDLSSLDLRADLGIVE